MEISKEDRGQILTIQWQVGVIATVTDAIIDNGGTISVVSVAAGVAQLVQVAAVTGSKSTELVTGNTVSNEIKC